MIRELRRRWRHVSLPLVIALGLGGCSKGSKPGEARRPDHRDVEAFKARWSEQIKKQGDYKTFTHGFLERVKKKTDPTSLQAWATNLLAQHKETDDLIRLPKERIPEFIKNLDPPFEATVMISPSASQLGPCVVVDFGGGWGHWGIVAGENAFKPPEAWNYLIEWVPGIFAYHTTR